MIAVSEPDDETEVVTLPRWTRAVGGAGGADEVVQATRLTATRTVGPTVRTTRRSATPDRSVDTLRCRPLDSNTACSSRQGDEWGRPHCTERGSQLGPEPVAGT